MAFIDSTNTTFQSFGCTDPAATNYNQFATIDDGSCIYSTDDTNLCKDPTANNFNQELPCTYDTILTTLGGGGTDGDDGGFTFGGGGTTFFGPGTTDGGTTTEDNYTPAETQGTCTPGSRRARTTECNRVSGECRKSNTALGRTFNRGVSGFEPYTLEWSDGSYFNGDDYVPFEILFINPLGADLSDAGLLAAEADGTLKTTANEGDRVIIKTIEPYFYTGDCITTIDEFGNSACEYQLLENPPVKNEYFKSVTDFCCTEQFVGLQVEENNGRCLVLKQTEPAAVPTGNACEDYKNGLVDVSVLQNAYRFCVDCDRFFQWDQNYTSLNGSSLKDTNPDLWNFLINLVNNEGGSFKVSNGTLEPLVDSECCEAIGSVYNTDSSGTINGVCSCEQLTTTTVTTETTTEDTIPPCGIDCEIKLEETETTVIEDAYRNQVSVITSGGQILDRDCCEGLALVNDLTWYYGEGVDNVERCYPTKPNTCQPTFKLNQEPIVPECETNLSITASFYFGAPTNSCSEIVTEDPDVVIAPVEEEECVLTFDESGNLIDANEPTQGGASAGPGTTESTQPCCYNSEIPIKARLIITSPTEETFNIVKEYSSVVDEFDKWITLETEVVVSDTLNNFDVKLEIYDGLNCCCTYDIFVDNLKVSCFEDETTTDTIERECPGFDVVKVIDNKKSWVYNPGRDGYSEKTEDTIYNQIGDTGLIDGYGTITRTFASKYGDDDLDWRYTDYFLTDSVREKHSDLVINSKEFFLTFNMSNIKGQCPNGYTLSGETCYKTVTSCPSGFILSGGTCYSGVTTATTVTNVLTEPYDPFACSANVSLLKLESFKKSFQSFWTSFIEQFVPATAIFVSGEKWSNSVDDICSVYEECDFDYEFVEGEVTVLPNGSALRVSEPTLIQTTSTNVDPSFNLVTSSPLVLVEQEGKDTGDGPIETESLTIIPLEKDLGETTVRDITYEENELPTRETLVKNYRNRFITNINIY